MENAVEVMLLSLLVGLVAKEWEDKKQETADFDNDPQHLGYFVFLVWHGVLEFVGSRGAKNA